AIHAHMSVRWWADMRRPAGSVCTPEPPYELSAVDVSSTQHVPGFGVPTASRMNGVPSMVVDGSSKLAVLRSVIAGAIASSTNGSKPGLSNWYSPERTSGPPAGGPGATWTGRRCTSAGALSGSPVLLRDTPPSLGAGPGVNAVH